MTFHTVTIKPMDAGESRVDASSNSKHMSDIFQKHSLADGRSVWIQRIKCPSVRKPQWTVVVTGAELLEAPTITDCTDKEQAFAVLADILRDDVCEVLN